MKSAQVKELVLQSLEHERGGVKIYEAAIRCATSEELKEAWQNYLQQTQRHVQALTMVCSALGLDSEEQTPGSRILHEMGGALVTAIESARAGGNAEAAQLVACECVVLAETKDHLDWELLGQVAAELKGDERDAMRGAYEQIEDEEDEHLYHTRGWCRELWLQSLGLKAVLPPPEERRDARTAISAARAEHARTKMR